MKREIRIGNDNTYTVDPKRQIIGTYTILVTKNSIIFKETLLEKKTLCIGVEEKRFENTL